MEKRKQLEDLPYKYGRIKLLLMDSGINPRRLSEVELRETCDDFIQSYLDSRDEILEADQNDIEKIILYLTGESGVYAHLNVPVDAGVKQISDIADSSKREFETTNEAATVLYDAVFDSIGRGDMTDKTAQNIIVLFQLHPMEYTLRLRDSFRAALQDFYNKVRSGLTNEPIHSKKQSSESMFEDEELQEGIDIIRILREYLQHDTEARKHPFDSYLNSRLTSPTAKGELDDYRKIAYERLLYLMSKSFSRPQ